MPEAFREYTRKAGVRLFLYYSGILDGIVGLRHPDWRMLDATGKPLEYPRGLGDAFFALPICPLSPYLEEHVAVHLEELITRYDPDGFWFDGDWIGPCHCPRCQERFRKETGLKGAMPEFNLETPEGAAWVRCWAGILHQWRQRLARKIKSLKPGCLYSAGNVTSRKEFLGVFDWRSGDWFSPSFHRLHVSWSMRRYTTLGLPYDAYTCDTAYVFDRPDIRPRTKSLPRMLQEGATVLANGGQWGYWTYPMPNGALIPSKMRLAVAAREFAEERRNLTIGTRAVEWTAILNAEPGAYISDECAPKFLGAVKALVALHRSPVVIDESQLDDYSQCDLMVVPENLILEERTVRRLEAFVRRGGKLITTGESIRSAALQKLLGVRLKKQGALDDGHVLLKGGNPAGVFAAWDRLELNGARELYPLYLSWDQHNPELRRLAPHYPINGMLDEENPERAGMPAATVRRLGRGTAVHLATRFFDVYGRVGNPDMLAWLREILGALQPKPLFRTDALSFVEVALRSKRDRLLIHFVNGNPGRDLSLANTGDLWVDDIPSVGPITGWIRCARKPGKATWEPGGTKAETRWKEGVLQFVLPRLDIHSCLVLAGWRPPRNR